MNIIIPIGGKGERFSNAGYVDKKPLIRIFDKPMVLYVLDNLNIGYDDRVYIIHYNVDDLETTIKNKYPNINFIKISKQTSGASETIFLGLCQIISNYDYKTKCVVLDCDTFYTQDILSLYRNMQNNAVFFTKNYETNPIYSYIEVNDNIITKIREKQKISNYANTGVYCFSDINELYRYSKFVVENNIRFNNECYTSCIIDKMIKSNHVFEHVFEAVEIIPQYVFNLGTPLQLETYITNTYIFLFDLDGTLVLTDDIYFKVWKNILKKYNIDLTHELFNSHICGNSDKTVITKFLPNNNFNLEELSQLKDDLFIKDICSIKPIDGIYFFLETLKKIGHRISIVSNCNRRVAECIVQHMNITKYIDFVIIGNECVKSKPYPDPYECAIKKYNTSNKKVIIFEDSKTGILSAKGVYPLCLVGIESIYDKCELIKYGVNLTIKNYNDCNIDMFTSYIASNTVNLENSIKKSIMNVLDVTIDDNKLKGGFISDVISLKVVTDKSVLDCVLKLENKNDTFLSKMAHDLCLYDREYYFYDCVCKYVPVKYPEFYGLVKDDDFNNIGILMKNLINENYKLHLNLNSESIDVSLRIIDSLAKLHSKFWNKDLSNNFKQLKKHNDSIFNPKWSNFIRDKWPIFKLKWSNMLTEEQVNSAERIVSTFQTIQDKMSSGNLTLCHGDVKSANIFFRKDFCGYEPYFIDWQYISIGKGVQDLVFLMVESFEVHRINEWKILFIEYYYAKLVEYGVKDYKKEEYIQDLNDAVCYFPFFVAVWFGTLNEDELIDKNFPFFFIQRLFNFLR